MRSRVTTTFLMTCLAIGSVVAAPAGAAVQSKCIAKKNGCVAKLAAGLLKCEQLAGTPGKPADPNAKDCVTKALAKFTGGGDPAKGCFAKLEAKPGNDCVVSGNASAAEATTTACVAEIVSAIDPPPLDQTKCGVAKKKCATKKLTGVLKCWAKAQTPKKPADPNDKDCVTKVVEKFEGAVPSSGCFAKLETKDGNDCAAPLGNTANVETVVDACVTNLIGVLETAPLCTPGATQACYTGPAGTAGVGPCAAGQQVCAATGLAWGPCTGEVTPQFDTCGNGIDEDCSGGADDPPDADGDGWTSCQGDCCDTVADGCTNPALVNPGALEVVANGVDDDCDATTSDVTSAACTSALKFSGVTAIDLARAMDLCTTTTASPPLPSRKWGIVSATLLNPNGTTPGAPDLVNIQNLQTAVLTGFGNVIVPISGTTLAGVSTGRMRDTADPGYVVPVPGSDFSRSLLFPTTGPLGAYLGAHGGGLLPGKCGAATCPTGTQANDGVLLRLVVRVPTNVQGLSYKFRFFSAEYQTFQCTQFNDYFLSLLTSGAPGLPADKNIAFDAAGAPVTVNNPSFLAICGGNSKSCNTCPLGTAQLAGTGLDTVNGAGTPWLTNESPVVPGETLTLDFLLADIGDGSYDTSVLLDDFRWLTAPTTLSTHP